MGWKSNIRVALSVSLILGTTSICRFGEAEQNKTGRPKMVFTNDDLQKYQDDAPPRLTVDMPTPEPEKAEGDLKGRPNSATSGQTVQPRSYWAARLKEAESNLNRAKFEEERFSQSLVDFRKRFNDAKTEFQKQTAQWQIEDTEKNLVRSSSARKKAEEKKAEVLAQATKQGFKAEDLQKEESAKQNLPAPPF